MVDHESSKVRERLLVSDLPSPALEQSTLAHIVPLQQRSPPSPLLQVMSSTSSRSLEFLHFRGDQIDALFNMYVR